MGLIDLKTDLKSLKYSSMPLGSDAPYITKDINNPPSSNRFSMQITKRVDDLSRIAQMLVDKPGLKYLGNEALLQQISNIDKIGKAQNKGKAVLDAVKSTIVDTGKIALSTLAQVPVNGTGTHFLKGFRTDTYLQPVGGNNASAFAQFFGAGGVEGAPFALRGEEVPGEHRTDLLGRASRYDYDDYLNAPTGSNQAKLNAESGKPITLSGPQYETTAQPYELGRSNQLKEADQGELLADNSRNLGKTYSSEETYTGKVAKDVIGNALQGAPIPVGPGTDTTAAKQTIVGSKPTDTTGSDLSGLVNNFGKVQYSDSTSYAEVSTNNATVFADEGKDIIIKSTGSFVSGESGQTQTVVKSTKYGYSGSVEVPIGENENKNKEQPQDPNRSSKLYAQTGAPVPVGSEGTRETTKISGSLFSKPTSVVGSDLSGTVNTELTNTYSDGAKSKTGTSTVNNVGSVLRNSKIAVPRDQAPSTVGGVSNSIGGTYEGPSGLKKISDFRSGSVYVQSSGIDYAGQNMETRITIGRQGKDRSGDSYQSVDGETIDKLNELPIGTERQDASREARDLAKFFFEIITPDDSYRDHGNFIHFRAYIDSIDDNYTADWQGHRYVGRAENFLTYGGFDRDINISFKIAAMTRSELKPLYQKMVYLASTTAPSYSDTFMRGTVVKLSLGSYFVQQPGVITSVKYSLIQDMPWEIAMQGPEGGESDVQELPMGLQCSVSFKPIHNFAPQTGLFNYFTSDVNDIKFFDPTEHYYIGE